MDYTSGLYLGLRHGSEELPRFESLTLGKPAALAAPPGADELARAVAALVGAEAATLGTSTLHLFWDLFGQLAKRRIAVFVDAGAYPVAKWSLDRMRARGVPVTMFAHFSRRGLRDAIRAVSPPRSEVIVVTDGYCVGCGRAAPAADFLEAVHPHRGFLVVDDSQSIGIFGRGASTSEPYGIDGAGALAGSAALDDRCVLVASLAKAFGSPLGVMAASRTQILAFEAASETRVHTSPPSSAVILAGLRALEVNISEGVTLRHRLAERVRQLRRGLRALGCRLAPGLHPMQLVRDAGSSSLAKLSELLARMGVRTALLRPPCGPSPALGFLITAAHDARAIERTLQAVARACGPAHTMEGGHSTYVDDQRG